MIAPYATVAAVFMAAAALAPPLLAHEGHNDAAPAAPLTTANAAPRVEANSELFEIVGTVSGGAMILFLDRFGSNEPVIDARIEVEAGEAKGVAQPKPDGTYSFKHPTLDHPSPVPVTFSIAVRGDSDLLTADLVVPSSDATNPRLSMSWYANSWWWGGGGLLLICVAVVAWLWRRRQRSSGASQ